ncbi:MAG: SEC-C metal-binding domain-containing protein, partial [Sedimenticola sp.]|nr:SEC-C metal-binding domain-containing protein [Sedimenticola sp.]
IHLRGYAQKNPKQEYKREAYEMFSNMLDNIKQEIVTVLTKVQIQPQEAMAIPQPEQPMDDIQFQHETFGGFGDQEEADQPAAGEGDEAHQPFVRSDRKVGRNEPCPCGSGKKYKQCHGRIE